MLAENQRPSRRDHPRAARARLSGEVVRGESCAGSGRWLTPMRTRRQCPCGGAEGDMGRNDVIRVPAICLTCRGQDAIGGNGAPMCSTCRGRGALAIRNRIVVANVQTEGTAA